MTDAADIAEAAGRVPQTESARMSAFHPLKVAEVARETDEAVSIRFAVPDDLAETFRFAPGQYLTLRTAIDGAEVRRTYSICAGLADGELRVAVKKVPDGLFSRFANDELAPGDVIEVMPPDGRFTSPIAAGQKKRYLLIAAGSGITPILSIAKSVLSEEPESEVALIYGNRTVSAIMFKEALDALKDRYPERFSLIHILSRQPQDVPLFNGRIDREKCETLFERLIDPGAQDEIFLCGPHRMTRTIQEVLAERGVPEARVHVELFQTDGEAEIAAARRARAEAMGADAAAARRVTVIYDGVDTSFELATDGDSVLDAALARRGDMPFSCKGGMCCTCRAKVVSGEVSMDVNYALTQEEAAAGFVLTCQSHPITPEVVIDYDQR